MPSRQKKIFSTNRKGFTLVEVLLVVSLMSLITFSIYNAFANGLRVWERGQRLVMEEDIAIFFDKLESDARNSFPYSLIPFSGKETSVSFPSLVRVLVASKTEQGKIAYSKQIGQVEYSFDSTKNILYRRESNYSQATQQKFAPGRTILSSVRDVQFKYFFSSAKKGLSKTDLADELPSSIQVAVSYWDAQGNPREMSRLVNLPLGLKP